ncbi:MAG: adenosine deaminase [Caldilineaceae bacterium]|nr:adenosine deaminase [Caldilineaceae bacterium]
MTMPFDRLDPDLQAFVAAMPKAEVHIHLEGAIQPETVLALAARHNMVDRLPSADLDELRRWFAFTDFPHFVRIYMTIQDMLRTPEDFALIVAACGADMAAQGIRYRELTVTPYTHTHLQDKGLTMADIQAGLDMGRAQAREAHGVEMRWVYDVPRNASFPRGYASHNGEDYNPLPAERTLDYAVAGMAHGVVGFGLGGYEVGAPPEPFAHAFAAAQEAGLLSVPHAGETVGAASVWGAVEALGAHRIGHGVRAIEDPALLTLLKEQAIPLEVNPTSNICLHVYRRLAEHPLPHLDRMGLVVTVNSDDPPLFNTRLLDEYAVLALEFGYDKAGMARLARNAFAVAGVEEEIKAGLLAEFDAWCAAQDVELVL